MSQFLIQSALKSILKRSRRLACACLAVALILQQADASITLDFNSLVHGEIVGNQFSGPPFNLTVSGVNVSSGPDLVVAFDTTLLNNTEDSDLEAPFSGGNLPRNTILGRVLIIQENDVGTDDGFADLPDDEGSRPAGSIFFDFDEPITEIGFDLLDVEGPDEFGDDSGFVATLFDANGNELARVGFNEFLPGGTFENVDDPVVFGDNSANRIRPITAADLNIENFTRVEINFGGSAAIDNLVYTPFTPPNQSVPEASSVLVWALLALTVGSYKRRQLFEE